MSNCHKYTVKVIALYYQEVHIQTSKNSMQEIEALHFVLCVRVCVSILVRNCLETNEWQGDNDRKER